MATKAITATDQHIKTIVAQTIRLLLTLPKKEGEEAEPAIALLYEEELLSMPLRTPEGGFFLDVDVCIDAVVTTVLLCGRRYRRLRAEAFRRHKIRTGKDIIKETRRLQRTLF